MELRFRVPEMSCEHCVMAVRGEIEQVAGVERVEVDLDTKVVVVEGTDLDREQVWAAVDDAGYEAVA